MVNTMNVIETRFMETGLNIILKNKIQFHLKVKKNESVYVDEVQHVMEEEDEGEEYNVDECDMNEEDKLQKTIEYGSTVKDGDYVIVSWNQRQYICKVWYINQLESKATCKFMRRDFSYIHDKNLKFQWPYVDDFRDVEDCEQNVLATVLNYELNRRGGFLIDSCIKEVFKHLN